MGCDMNAEYCSWAAIRLEQVPRRTVEEWIDMDRQNAVRRENVRNLN